jgi:hypothetical protein
LQIGQGNDDVVEGARHVRFTKGFHLYFALLDRFS